LSIFEKPSRSEEAEARARLEIALHDIPPERRREFITSYLENLPYRLRQVLEESEGIKNIMVAIGKEEIEAPRLKRHMVVTKKLEETEEKDCQKVVVESELEQYLARGWRVQAVLPSGKIVVEK